MEKYIIIVISSILSFALGYFCCYFLQKKPKDGSVIIEETSDRERTCVRFVLDSDLNEIEKKKSLYFEVINKLSK